jgi:hypothetical protein
MTALLSATFVLWAAVAASALVVLLVTFRYIPNDRVGIVEKLWSPTGSVKHGIQTLATAESEKIRLLGEGEAKRIQVLAGADAERTARVGVAQAMAIEEQVRAYGGPRLQLTQQVLNRFAEAIQASQVDVVPKILIAGQNGKDGGSPMTGNVMEALLTLMLSDRVAGDITTPSAPRNASADAIRKRIEDDMKR